MLEEIRHENSQRYGMGATGQRGVKKMIFKGIPGEFTPSLAELMNLKGSYSPNCREANVHPSVEEGDSSGN